MSRRRKKNRRPKTEDGSSAAKESPEPQVPSSTRENENAKPLRTSLGAFALVLGAQFLLLGFFYTMAGAYPAAAKLRTLKQAFIAEPGKTVEVSARIRYTLPKSLPSRPGQITFRINLEGQAPVNREVKPAALVKVSLTAPQEPGVPPFTLVADPDGSAGIGPLKATAALKVVAPAKSTSP